MTKQQALAAARVTPERVAEEVAEHYIATGEPAFGVDLATRIGCTRVYLDAYMGLTSVPFVRCIAAHNPRTATQRKRKSLAYLPTLEALRNIIVRESRDEEG